MNSSEAVLKVVAALDQLGIPFMVVGSFSSNIHGIPRSTKDADFVVQMGDQSFASLASAIGSGFVMDPQLSFETVTGTSVVRLKHRDTDFMIELFALSNDPHDQERFARRVQGDIGGRQVSVASAEDVIIMKLRWALRAKRPKDLDDVRGVILVQGVQLDLDYIRRWTDEHGTRDLMERMLSGQRNEDSGKAG